MRIFPHVFRVDDQFLKFEICKQLKIDNDKKSCIFIDMTGHGYGIVRRYSTLRQIKTRLESLRGLISTWKKMLRNKKKDELDEVIDKSIIKNAFIQINDVAGSLKKYTKPRKNNTGSGDIKQRFAYNTASELIEKLITVERIIDNALALDYTYDDIRDELLKALKPLSLSSNELFNEIQKALKHLLKAANEDRREFFITKSSDVEEGIKNDELIKRLAERVEKTKSCRMPTS